MTDLPPLTVELVENDITVSVLPETPQEIEIAVVKVVENSEALLPDDIGVTVQPYSVDTVIDPDYNQFSDAEKTKLEGIESGAQVNPDLSSYETTTQLNTRDTNNRNRANHTGTQTASTISDFDTEVSNNTDVAANTSARHDAVTVVDSSEIDFTLTGQQITASIVAGSIDESKLNASVNASLDLADSSVQLTGDQSIAGTKTFTGALILPNNSRINGVEHFYQTTKPTTRGDATALVVGDRWYKTDDVTEWSWNGTYWLAPPQTYMGTSLPLPLYQFESIFIHYVYVISAYYTGIANESNYYRLGLSPNLLWATAGTIVEFDTIPTTQMGYRARPTFYGNFLINSVRTSNSGISVWLLSTVGSPGSRYTYLLAKVSEIFP